MNKRIKNLFLFVFIIFCLLLTYSCINQKSGKIEGADNKETNKITLENEASLMAVLWCQASAEYRALAYQAYNIARLRLDEELQINRNQKRAVIVDIDETVLDNSRYNAKEITDKQVYPDDFYKWIDMAKAEAIPGAKEFLDYAVSKNCDVFYISNRRIRCLDGTLRNLKKLGFPQADKNHVLLKGDVSSKEGRRQEVAKTHYIVLLIGDNLIDFSEVFDIKSVEGRLASVEKYKDNFGKKFIVLPNPMHGAWFKALYDYDRNLSKEERTQRIIRYLKSY
ncbi:MAG: 5'-nucleotidase, lipoprotein e(P4) family [Candidatus Cloacimonetes bacterium]|nr:5'-nucleotidase, lipoprotein e(P4) family [Candidatus Cloacimonadota bacterium]